MSAIFQPEKRKLTDEQLTQRVDGTPLSYAEMQALRNSCGLLCDQGFLEAEIMPDRLSATAWRKIRRPASALCSVPPL